MATLSLQPRHAPICIGVVGHLDVHPEDEALASDGFAALLDALVAGFPNSPLRLVSPLALGADRIAARAFIRRRDALAATRPDIASRWELVVPMPLPRDLYVADFPEAIGEFDELLAQAASAFSLPTRPGIGLVDISRHGPARDLQYQDASRYVATHCDILVAIWDGLDPGKIGGTCDTIRLRIQAHVASERMHFSPLAEIARPVLHVPVRRSRTDAAAVPAADLVRDPLVSTGVPAVIGLAEGLRSIDRFNAMAAKLPPGSFHASVAWCMGAAVRDRVLVPGLSRSRRDCLELFATADAIATRLGRRWERLTRAVYALGIASVSVLPFAVEGFGLPWSMIAYIGGLAVAAVLVLWMRRESIEDDHVESRALAEMLRIQFAWLFSDMPDRDNPRNPSVTAGVEVQKPVMAILLGQQQREMGWIARVLTHLVLVRHPEHDELPAELRRKVVEDWIDGQMEYCRKSASRAEKRVHGAERVTMPLVVLALCFAMGAAFLAFLGDGHMLLRHVFVALSAALPIAAIVIENAVDRIGGGDHARMRKRLGEIYAASRKLLSREDLPAETRTRVLTETGREAVAEATTWLFLRRIRPVKVSI